MTDDKEQIQSLYGAMYEAMMAKGVAAPIVGATKVPHFDAAVRAVDLALTKEDIAFLEEPYKAHEIVGALARTDSNGI